MQNKEDLQKQVQMIRDTAESIIISNEEELQNATNFIKDLKQKQKVVSDFYEPMVKATKESYDKIRNERDNLLKPLKNTEVEIRGLMNDYNNKIMAQKRAEEERIQKEKEMQEKKLLEAQENIKNGNIEKGESQMQEILNNTTLISRTVNTPKITGMATRTTYKVEITDINKMPTTYNNVPLVELSKIGKKYLVEQYKIAKTLKQDFKISGLKITEEVTTVIS